MSTSAPVMEPCDPKNPQDKEVHRAPILPLKEAPFTLKDVKQAIPKHCFERSYAKSFGYLFANAVVCYLFSYVAPLIRQLDLPWYGLVVAWPLYWFLQGCFMTGMWVIGHECGHGGFTDSKSVNDIVGLIVHTSLLVPYHAWAHTHGVHHQYCGSMEHDEVFVPNTESQVDVDNPLMFSAPVRFFQILRFLFLGWPFYLIMHVTGPRKYDGQWTNHYNPYSPCFPAHKRAGVIMSDVALVGFTYFLYTVCQEYGFLCVASTFLCPLLVTNMWLVIITQLQHTNLVVPHYRGDEWSWLRGALATIDRSYGPFLDVVFHHIQDTHVCHHIFSSMPFYHAVEATKHMKKVLGKYHLEDQTPVAKAVWDCYRDCIFVKDKGSVLFYHGHPTQSVTFEDYFGMNKSK